MPYIERIIRDCMRDEHLWFSLIFGLVILLGGLMYFVHDYNVKQLYTCEECYQKAQENALIKRGYDPR